MKKGRRKKEHRALRCGDASAGTEEAERERKPSKKLGPENRREKKKTRKRLRGKEMETQSQHDLQ
jgi:hypothetical protein